MAGTGTNCHSPLKLIKVMTTFLRRAGAHELPVTAPLMPENIPGMKEIKGLIKVDIINSN